MRAGTFITSPRSRAAESWTAGLRASFANGSLQKRFHRNDAFAVAIDAMFAARNPLGQFGSFCPVAAEQTCDRNVFIDRPRRRLAHLHHLQNRGGMAAAHRLSGEGDDRRVMKEGSPNRGAAPTAEGGRASSRRRR